MEKFLIDVDKLQEICKFYNLIFVKFAEKIGISANGNRRIEKTLPKYELLTTHCARRTFVVTALQLGIPAEVIMRWTGHSDFAAIKPYIAIVDELKARSMALFNAL